MAAETGDVDHREEPRQVPFLIAFLGLVAVAFALLLPISTTDAESGVGWKCGDALSASAEWHNADADSQLAMRDECSAKRISRIAVAVGAVSLTLAVVTLILAVPAARRRRAEPLAAS